MEDANEEKSSSCDAKIISVFKVILFTVVTFGIYPSVWFVKRRPYFNNLVSGNKFGYVIPVGLVIVSIISLVISLLEVATIYALDKFIEIIVIVGLLYQSFKARKIMLEHYNTNLNKDIDIDGIFTLFLGFIYLQYKINKIHKTAA